MPATPSVSVIIPSLNETAEIVDTLESIEIAASDTRCEVIVVDGGSVDDTVERVVSRGNLRLLTETDGLAAQLNCGARAATGDILLFLYADTRLPPNALGAVLGALKDEAVVGGAFRLSFSTDQWFFRFVARLANVRTGLGLGPFGDQGIFVRRAVFHDVGGFHADRFLEDFDLVRLLRRRGRFRVLSESIRTSARRWKRDGIVKTTLTHSCMTLAYLLGKRSSKGADTLDRLRTTR